MKRSIKTAVLLLAMVAIVYGFLFIVIDLYKMNTSLSDSVIRNTYTIESLYKELKDTNKGFLGLLADVKNTLNKQQKLLEQQGTLNALFSAHIGNIYKQIEKNNFDTNLIKANVFIRNNTIGAIGSGTWIKIDDKPYVLTAAHMGAETDEIVVVNKDKREYSCVVVKRNKKIDLMLLRVRVLKPTVIAKIAEKEPKVSSEIFVVGNPGGYKSVTTRGIISKKGPGVFICSVPGFFGNSGGALYYKNELIGVTSFAFSMTKVYPSGIFIDQFLGFVDLKTLKEFLKLDE